MFDKQHIFVLSLLILTYVRRIFSSENKLENFTNIVAEHGYPAEVHVVETEDGYLLNIYRVPYGRKSSTKKPNNHPLLLNHGLMGSAENFLVGGPTKALTYVLADHGYDVWLCNARGTWHSRKHRSLDPDRDMRQFWRFTWHEIGYYDLPATIDYILNITKKDKLHYIGHSQGTTTFFVMASEKPEYNNKVNVMVAMAPSALIGHIRDLTIRMLAPSYKYFQALFESFRIYELIPGYLLSNDAVRLFGKRFCAEEAVTKELCSNVLIAVAGFTSDQLDPASIPLIVSTSPAGASIYQVLHYGQLVVTGKFMQYDWDRNENMMRYKSETPREYNFNNITCPVSLIYGESDVIVTKEDVEILATRLPNVVDLYKVPYENWSHLDFIWAKDVDIYLNKHLLSVLNKFN